jgi:hypothetical protein
VRGYRWGRRLEARLDRAPPAGWLEGIELNFFGGVFGLDIRRPAQKLPGLGRLGVPQIHS